MYIKLSPQRSDKRLTLEKQNQTLIINGESFDFSELPEGATLPRDAIVSDVITSDVERIDGEIHLTVLLPHGANAPEETRFPEPISATEDGIIALPPYDIVVEEEFTENE